MYLVKQENTVYKQSKLARLHCSSCGDIIYTYIFTVSLTLFIKKNSSRHNYIMAFEIRRITMLINNKDDIELFTELQCFLGHPVHEATCHPSNCYR